LLGKRFCFCRLLFGETDLLDGAVVLGVDFFIKKDSFSKSVSGTLSR
jgi:hypothetical protein